MNKRLFRFKMFEHFQEEKENNVKTQQKSYEFLGKYNQK